MTPSCPARCGDRRPDALRYHTSDQWWTETDWLANDAIGMVEPLAGVTVEQPITAGPSTVEPTQ